MARAVVALGVNDKGQQLPFGLGALLGAPRYGLARDTHTACPHLHGLQHHAIAPLRSYYDFAI